MHRVRTGLASIVTLLALLVGSALPALGQLTDVEQKLFDAALDGKESVTWYITHYTAETAESLGKAFQQKYPGVPVNVVRTTAQVAFQRLNQDLKAGNQQCDVFSTTDLGHYSQLKGKGLLMKYVPAAAAKAHKQFQGLDPDGTFHITSAGLVVIAYNIDKLQGQPLPSKWTDLLDPKWKNAVTLGHPAYSAYAGTWVVLMRKLYGWDYFKKLEALKPQIGRSINDTVTMLNSGERSVAAGPLATTLKSASKGSRIGVVYPEDGALFMIAPSAIVKDTKNTNAAKLFMEFLYSVEASKVAVEDFSESMRPEVPPPTGGKPLSEVKTLRPTFGEIEKGIPEVIEAWRDIFGI